MKLFLVIILVGSGMAAACSGYESAGSPSVPNTNVPSNEPAHPPLNATSQDKASCSLNLSQAPVIYGLKLGMTPDEVLALFPGAKDDPEVRASLSKPPSQFGTSSFGLRPEKYEGKEKFLEISKISFSLLDGRVYTFSVGYNGPQWPHVDKFVAKFIEGRDLPAVDQWQPYAGMDSQLKTLRCADFEVRVFAGGEGGNLNYVLIQDLEADQKLKDRRAKWMATQTPSPEKQ